MHEEYSANGDHGPACEVCGSYACEYYNGVMLGCEDCGTELIEVTADGEVSYYGVCEGHPAGPYDPMGETVYCDGSCVGVARPAMRTVLVHLNVELVGDAVDPQEIAALCRSAALSSLERHPLITNVAVSAPLAEEV